MRIRPQPGPQTKAAKSKAKIIVYGGAAGGGKSWFQGYRASKYHRKRGYTSLLARRTHKQLKQSGGLWDQARELCQALGAQPAYPFIRWPGFGSKIEFSHMQHPGVERTDHKSAQYAYFGADEASDFEGSQLLFMQSRVRSPAGVPTQTMYTTNPDPDCYLRELIDWWIAEDGYPIPERDGVLRWMARVRDEIVWGDSREALEPYVDSPVQVKSVTFIAAKLQDNRILMEADPDYEGNLKNLPAVDRARFEGGNWDIKEAAGDYFQRGWFPALGSSELERVLCGQVGAPWDEVESIRFWDRAASPVAGETVPTELLIRAGRKRPDDFVARELASYDKPPDFTFGVKLARLRNGQRVLRDVAWYRDTPGAIEAAMVAHAIEDGPRTTVGFWQDPGQAGIDQAERAAQEISKHANVWYTPQQKSKTEYAREPSRAAWRGEIMVETRPECDLRLFWSQLEGFDGDPKKKDDAVDAFAGAELFFALEPTPQYTGYMAGSALVRPTARQIDQVSRLKSADQAGPVAKGSKWKRMI